MICIDKLWGCFVYIAQCMPAVYVEIISTGILSYTYEGNENIKITPDFTFDEKLKSGLDQTIDDYGKELFPTLAEGRVLEKKYFSSSRSNV